MIKEAVALFPRCLPCARQMSHLSSKMSYVTHPVPQMGKQCIISSALRRSWTTLGNSRVTVSHYCECDPQSRSHTLGHVCDRTSAIIENKRKLLENASAERIFTRCGRDRLEDDSGVRILTENRRGSFSCISFRRFLTGVVHLGTRNVGRVFTGNGFGNVDCGNCTTSRNRIEDFGRVSVRSVRTSIGRNISVANKRTNNFTNVNVRSLFSADRRDNLTAFTDNNFGNSSFRSFFTCTNRRDDVDRIFSRIVRKKLEESKSGVGVEGRRSYVSKKDYTFSPLKEEELEEMFVRGSGPGGQSVNQTANCVVLKHLPSGIVVKCHETRSLHKNRERARERLQERLDLHVNGDSSFLSQQQEEASLRRKEKKKRNKQRLQMKKAFKEREGIDARKGVSAAKDEDNS